MAAGLNNANADALAVSLATALNITDVASKAVLQATWRAVYAALKTDIAITVTVTSVSGVTTGGGVSGPGAGTGVPV